MKASSEVARTNITQLSREAERDFTGLFLPFQHDNAQARVLAEIADLSLQQNAWELDNLGYTVVRPEQVGAGDLARRLREKRPGPPLSGAGAIFLPSCSRIRCSKRR